MTERRENARERGRKRQSSRGAYGMCLALSLSLLFLLILGLLLPLRPSYSESEKRKLAELPAPSLRTLSDGSWFRDFSGWYSDTFPFREKLLSWEASLEKYYGFQGEAIYSKGERKKESIPETAGERPGGGGSSLISILCSSSTSAGSSFAFRIFTRLSPR